MHGYSTKEVAQLIGVSPARVRTFVRAGLVGAQRDAGRGYRFSFQDIVLLRAAKSLEAASISPRKVNRALRAIRAALPDSRPLTALRIAAEGDEVIVRDGQAAWLPESGQATFDFSVAELAGDAVPMVRAAAEAAVDEDDTSAEDWFALALDLETVGATDEAIDAYQRLLAADARHVEAHINLGHLVHEQGRAEEAEAHYRRALAEAPGHTTALFNLGVALEDRERFDEAVVAYEQAIAGDPDHADAHFNVARLHEAAGRRAAAFRHFSRYRTLME